MLLYRPDDINYPLVDDSNTIRTFASSQAEYVPNVKLRDPLRRGAVANGAELRNHANARIRNDSRRGRATDATPVIPQGELLGLMPRNEAVEQSAPAHLIGPLRNHFPAR